MTEQSDDEVTDEAHLTEAEIASQLEYYAPVIGLFKGDPVPDAMMANIRENKKKMNADDNIR